MTDPKIVELVRELGDLGFTSAHWQQRERCTENIYRLIALDIGKVALVDLRSCAARVACDVPPDQVDAATMRLINVIIDEHLAAQGGKPH